MSQVMPGYLIVEARRGIEAHDKCLRSDAARHRTAGATWICEEPVQYAAWKAKGRLGRAHATMRPSMKMRASKVASSGCLL